MDKVYHYTNDNNWQMLEFGYFSSSLLPKRPLVGEGLMKRAPRFAKKPHTYFFDEAYPATWMADGKAWNKLLRCISGPDPMIKILEVDAPSDLHVLDWSFMEKVRLELDRMHFCVAEKSDLERVAEAAGKYLASHMPIDCYQGGYALPEFVTRQVLPISKVRVIDEFLFDVHKEPDYERIFKRKTGKTV